MKINKLKIVLDTNIILASVSLNSIYRKVFDDFVNMKYDLFIDHEIILEYEEKLLSNFNKSISDEFIKLLLKQPNVRQIRHWYKLNLISADPDDNKFVDCAFACNADFIVSNDKHFHVLKTIEFPKLNVLKIGEFIELLETL